MIIHFFNILQFLEVLNSAPFRSLNLPANGIKLFQYFCFVYLPLKHQIAWKPQKPQGRWHGAQSKAMNDNLFFQFSAHFRGLRGIENFPTRRKMILQQGLMRNSQFLMEWRQGICVFFHFHSDIAGFGKKNPGKTLWDRFKLRFSISGGIFLPSHMPHTDSGLDGSTRTCQGKFPENSFLNAFRTKLW